MSLAPVSPSTGPVSSPPPSPAVVLLGVFDTYSSTQTETTLIYLSGLPLRLVRAGLGALMRDGEVYSPETGKWTRIRPTPPTPSQPLPGSPKNPSSGILLYPPTNLIPTLAIPPTQLRSEVAGKIEMVISSKGPWFLPGSCVPYEDCGSVKGKAFCPVEHTYKYDLLKSCGRAACADDWGVWIKRAVNRVSMRLMEWSKVSNYPPRSIVYSISQGLMYKARRKGQKNGDFMGIDVMRRWFATVLKKSGIRGGFHTMHLWRFREVVTGKPIKFGLTQLNSKCTNPVQAEAYFSPHWHVIGVGRLMDAVEFEKRTGWVYKNLTVHPRTLASEPEIRAAVYYMLSHTATHKRHRAYSYFGLFSYRKCKGTMTTTKEPLLCPDCSAPLIFAEANGAVTTRELYTEIEHWTFVFVPMVLVRARLALQPPPRPLVASGSSGPPALHGVSVPPSAPILPPAPLPPAVFTVAPKDAYDLVSRGSDDEEDPRVRLAALLRRRASRSSP